MNFFSKLKISTKRGFTRTPKSLVSGFTLTELIVVITIATIIMTALVVQQSSWNDSLSVNTQTYELALMIRQAQIYSLGVKENAGSTGDKFNIGYGIYFDTTYNRYIFFADRDGDGKYDSNVNPNLDEKVESDKVFTRGVTIEKFCNVSSGGAESCSTAGGTGNYVKLAITFFRPDTKARILFLNGGGSTVNGTYKARIYLKSKNEKISSVIIEPNGQVSIIQ